MIVVVHNNQKVLSSKHLMTNESISLANTSILPALFELANRYDEFVIWVQQDGENLLNIVALESIFHHKKIMASFASNNYFTPELGFVHDSTPNANVNKSVTYATWFMVDAVGGMHLSVIKQLNPSVYLGDSFNYFLYSVALLGMYKESLFCYSEPKLLLRDHASVAVPNATKVELFRFVYQHQLTKWTFFLLLNYLIFKKEFPFWAFITAFFSSKRHLNEGIFDSIEVASTKVIEGNFELDVIIPTIGRKNYLHDVLLDFSQQTILPQKIIIVEQNPLPDSQTDLDYITNETWPFPIEHIFIHQSGACNARNLALSKTTSNWVFLADDDNRFAPNLLEQCYQNIQQYGCEALTTSYLQENEKQTLTKVLQWPTFGAGNSIVKRVFLVDIQFDLRLEFGYGEDADFGMKLRNKGIDIVYFPDPNILHLKAPIGGFRTKPILPWHQDKVQPKPSPTIMLFALLHKSKEQIQGYKTRLFIKNYQDQRIKNPFAYFSVMKKQWKQSVSWANYLKDSK